MPIYKNKRLKGLIKVGHGIMFYPEFHDIWMRVKDRETKVLLALLFFTGARPVELRELTAAHFRIDEDRNRIYVSIPTAKKKKLMYRILPLSLKYPEVQYLKKYVLLSRKIHPGRYILPMKNVKKARDWISYRLKKARIPYPPYFFRHNFASILYTKGVELRKIAVMRGTSEKVTEEVYSHFAPSAYDEVADMF